jgi:hypothetical protein
MFGLPEQPCGRDESHVWHTDGTAWCPGQYAPVSWRELGAMAHGLGGNLTVRDGRAILELDGELYAADIAGVTLDMTAPGAMRIQAARVDAMSHGHSDRGPWHPGPSDAEIGAHYEREGLDYPH